MKYRSQTIKHIITRCWVWFCINIDNRSQSKDGSPSMRESFHSDGHCVLNWRDPHFSLNLVLWPRPSSTKPWLPHKPVSYLKTNKQKKTKLVFLDCSGDHQNRVLPFFYFNQRSEKGKEAQSLVFGFSFVRRGS